MSQWRIFRETHGLPYIALRFLSGSQSGTEAPLKQGDEATLGRGRDVDVIIEDRKASRHHARLYFANDQLFVKDLGSVNGTLVNGAKVDLKPVYPGDLIQIAGTRMKLEQRKRVSQQSWTWWREQKKLQLTRGAASEALTMGNALTGKLENVSIEDLMQLLAGPGRSGVLLMDTVWGTGEVCFRDGRIFAGAFPAATSPTTLESVARLIRAQTGEFEFCAGDATPPDNAIEVDHDELLAIASALAEEFRTLEALLPAPGTRLKRRPEAAPDPATAADTDELLRLAEAPTPVAVILDRHTGEDLEAVRKLISLIKAGVIGLV